MHKMMALHDHMEDELKDGKSYAECASQCKDTDHELCDLYLQMAKERLEAFKRLKQSASRIYENKVRQAKDAGKDVTDFVEFYEYCSKKMADKESSLAKCIEAVR